ncbi:uncharacterized protein BDZ99DRAFT_252290 [Mytilinidion resinicola]|uniref:Uncharacterized protein n=1 Tax=Mytilinidion resinicola TaxID=574789 RepID=A0A6A6YZ76_9PEZI|nr:uncharacterized protein BDZ99DRAFT_252290 [Mytilinidion resinicola]KAF2813257.1 hypothetical protein BDZ99DRAFT_252290 [Mytilinidion resinicola]
MRIYRDILTHRHSFFQSAPVATMMDAKMAVLILAMLNTMDAMALPAVRPAVPALPVVPGIPVPIPGLPFSTAQSGAISLGNVQASGGGFPQPGLTKREAAPVAEPLDLPLLGGLPLPTSVLGALPLPTSAVGSLPIPTGVLGSLPVPTGVLGS